MFKRIRWMGLGAAAGAGASVWAQVRLRRSLDEHPAIEVGTRAARGLRVLGGELRGAVADGREAMAAREAALRDGVGARFGTSPARPGDPGGPRRLRLVAEPEEAAVDPAPVALEPPDGDGPPPGGRAGRSGTHPAGRSRRRRLRSS